MYIKELIIYGYGKFEQLSLKLQSFQLIYGENEAGKSTIMSFIHSILFGFPLKQQTELRYEPKLNAKYGGQLVIETSKWGTVRIERVKGKAIGDVTVFLEDGTRGGDELLQEILNGMDKSTYQSIYSFNNQGLQNVHQLKGDELSQFLFSTSVIGTEKIMAVQNMLEKELDKRFKPYGSKPVLNVQLNQVEQTEKKLTEVKKEVAKYEDLLVEFEKVRTEIEAKRNELESLNHELIVKKEWNRMYPLLLDKQEITRRLQALGDVTFPEDGLTQFNQNEAELKRLTERLAPLYEQKKKLEEELKSIQLDEQVLQHAFDIQQMIEDLPTYKQQLDLYKQTETRLIQLDQEIQDKLTQLDYQAKIDDIAHFDLSFAQKDKITTFVNRKIQLLELRADLERRDEEVRHKLNELEKFIDELKAETLSSQVKQAYEKQLEQAEEQKQARKELDWVTTQLSLLQGRNKQSQGKKLFQLGFISCFVLAIGFLYSRCLN